ncbi:MAG: peptidase [Ottowia sp.]|nr:MAG: peptidase [Ottowia sp.]
MNTRTPQTLLLPLAVTLALAACSKKEDAAPAAAAPAAPEYTLDESTLPGVNRFTLADLDSSQDACADFAGYANSKWLAANPIPGDRTSWGAFEMLDERSNAVQHQLVEQAAADASASGVKKIVGDLWATGMDEAKANAQGIEPLAGHLAAIDALADGPAVAEYLRTRAAAGENFLFGFGAEADFKNPDLNIAYAMQGGLGLPDSKYYFDPDKKDIRDAYVAHIAKVLELSGVAAADAQKQATEVMAFETRLAKVSKSREDMSRDVSLFYNPVSLADADQLAPNFPWTKFFESQGVAAPEMFSLAIPAFHQEVSKALGDTDASVWRSYLRFHTVDGASPYLSDAFAQENFNFYARTLRGQKEMKPRWKRVLATVNEQAGEALGQMYVQVAFPAESKAKMEALVANLGTALKARIEHLEWMGEDTKAKALAKQAAFTPKIGYPDKWREWAGLETSRDSYIGNVLAAQEFNYRWNLSKIGQPVDKSEWGMPPQMVNAYYNPLQNEIVFPAAILQPPFFDAKGFSGRTDKLIAQFDGYTTADGQKINGRHTLGENIADLGGLATAYDAMKSAAGDTPDPMTDGLTRDQRFFLNWATVWRRNFTPEELKNRIATDEHAPAQFRAVGAPSNLPAFAAAFKCEPGKPMVRQGDNQVVIW